MNNESRITLSSQSNSHQRSCLTPLLLIVAALLGQSVWAADIVWTGGVTTNTGTRWAAGTNWAGGVAPTSADNAVFDTAGTVTTCAIDFSTNSGAQQVGSVTLGSGRTTALSIRALTTSSRSGTLFLNGVGGTLLSNISTLVSLTFEPASTGTNLSLGLLTSGNIYANSVNPILPPTTAGQVSIISPITESGGSRSITKLGPGILYLRATNTYSGSTTVSNGSLQVDDVGTIGNGSGTLFLSGGNFSSGATRSGTSAAQVPVANPIVLNNDAYIYSLTGTSNSTRYLALSGTVSGPGTLKIANPAAVVGNSFIVRMFNPSLAVSNNIIVGESSGAYSDNIFASPPNTSTLQLVNSNGVQTFSGNISGVGSLSRHNPLNSSVFGGASILTGNNTYSGGTYISNGCIYANNTVGSALGSGLVLVTNLGMLAGNGAVVAPTTVGGNGTISPGATSTGITNLAVSDLTFAPGANYIWQINSATGTAGANWDLITCSSGWTDAVGAGAPATIYLDSMGAVPAGWSAGIARDWVIIQSSSATGFDDSHFTINTDSFTNVPTAGIFSLTNVSGALHLRYTPAADLVINVASGSQTQGGVSPTPYPLLTGSFGVLKVGNGEVVMTNSANNYLGSTKIYAGTASAAVDAPNGSPGAFGDASSALQLGNTLGNSNATLNISVAGVTVARSVVVQAGSSGVKAIGTTVSSGAVAYSGDVTLQDSATLNVPVGGVADFSGNFAGSGGLTFSGGGVITMGALNSYAGPSTLTAGTLNLNAKALGTNTFTISAASTIDNTSGASVTLNDCPQNWNADFTFTGTTNLNLGGGAVTLSGSRSVTVSASTLTVGGAIGGSGGLTKLGNGTLVFSPSTGSSYTGNTTNAAGTISVNASASFGTPAGTLVLAGGNILNTGTRSGNPISNAVVMTASTTIYGNSTATAPSTRIFPFSGNWSVTGGTLRIGNTGSSNNTFEARFTGGYDVTWPVVVGDPAFDTPGAISVFELYNDNAAPVQIVSGFISGNGVVRRGNLVAGAGGTSVFTANNTYSGGTVLDSGTIGIGLDSTPTSGVLTSGPLGTGALEIDNDPAVYLFASGGARTIGNFIFLNGVTNTVFTGTNELTFTGDMNLGGVTKTFTVSNTALTTLSGVMTNDAPLIKAGPGKLVFAGDNSTRVGTTTINEGTLLVNNTAGSGTGTNAVIVNASGTLGGSGTIAGLVSGTGNIAPGQSAGVLTLGGGLDLNAGGTYAWELATNSTNNPGTNFDIIPVTGGNLFLGGSSKLSINLTGSATVPDAGNPFWQSVREWTIIPLSGGATNIGPTVFPTILNGTNAAGYFTNFADAGGSIVLQFIPSAAAPTPPPQPILSKTIVGANTASAVISWSATNGYTYTVQLKTNLTQPSWIPLGTATASGTNATFTDTTGPRPQSYYRVIWP